MDILKKLSLQSHSAINALECEECGDHVSQLFRYDRGEKLCLTCFVNLLMNVTEYEVFDEDEIEILGDDEETLLAEEIFLDEE